PRMRQRPDSSSPPVGTPRTSLSGAALTPSFNPWAMENSITPAPVYGERSPRLMPLHRALAPHVCGREKSSLFGVAQMRLGIRSELEQSITLPLIPGHLSQQPALLRRVRVTPRSGTAPA